MSSENPEPPTVTTVPKSSPFGALLTRTLPNFAGPHQVGVCDVEVPVKRQTFGTFRHTKLPNAEAGLSINTVLFSLFYPAQPTDTSKRVVWFPKFGQTIDGFLRMARRTPNAFYRSVSYPLAAAAIYGTTFPAHQDAPIKLPTGDTKWPLMIFSHGVGCSRLMYSAFCCEMASHGYVVVAIEHRDGTGPSSTIRGEDGTKARLDWLDWRDIEWPDLPNQPVDDTTLRHEQLKVRLAEIDETLKALDMISLGEPRKETPLTLTPDYDWSRWTCLEVTRPVMAGHSFGGSVGLLAASDSRFSFKSVIVFDPAIQRLEPWTGTIPYPLLTINSEEFAVSDDFPRLIGVVKTAESSSIFVIAGTTHPSFSDIHLILPGFMNRWIGLSVDAQAVFSHTIPIINNFLAGKVEGPRASAKKVDGDLKRPVGKPGDLLLFQ